MYVIKTKTTDERKGGGTGHGSIDDGDPQGSTDKRKKKNRRRTCGEKRREEQIFELGWPIQKKAINQCRPQTGSNAHFSLVLGCVAVVVGGVMCLSAAAKDAWRCHSLLLGPGLGPTHANISLASSIC